MALLLWTLPLLTWGHRRLSVTLSFYGCPVQLEAVAQPVGAACSSPQAIAQELANTARAQQANFAHPHAFARQAGLDGMATYLLLQKACTALKYPAQHTALLCYAFLAEEYDVVLHYSKGGQLELAKCRPMRHTRIGWGAFASCMSMLVKAT